MPETVIKMEIDRDPNDGKFELHYSIRSYYTAQLIIRPLLPVISKIINN